MRATFLPVDLGFDRLAKPVMAVLDEIVENPLRQ
jgi:hypothetical protein